MIWLKILGPLALAALLAWGVHDWQRLKGIERDGEACVAQVAEPMNLAPCPKPIVDVARGAWNARMCDEGLAQSGSYAVLRSCSAAVKKRDAEATAATAERDNLKRELADAEVRQAAAVDRATARSETLIKRKADARDAILRAPAGGDGTAVCDASCLRALNGD